MANGLFEPWKGSRMAESFRAMVELLQTDGPQDNGWHPWTDIVQASMDTSGILAKSASNQIHAACQAGIFVRRGREEYREVKLAEAGPFWIEGHKEDLGWTVTWPVKAVAE